MKEKIAVAISFISFGLIYFGLDTIADTLGVPTYIDFGETVTVTRGSGPGSYDEDINGERTDVGVFIFFASIMLAWRIYHWIVSGKFGGNISKESHTTWLFWLLGMTSYILVTTPIWQIEMPGILQHIIVFGCGAGIAWFGYNKHSEAITKIRAASNDDT
jgi:hypothetical protein